jgi:hypothetical protein
MVAMAALSAAASTAAAQVTLSKSYGLDQFRPSPGTYSNKTVDATGASFTVANSKNSNPTWSYRCDKGSLRTNLYPLNLDRHNNIVFRGGRVDSNVPQGSEWSPTYCNSAAVIVLDSDKAVIDGTRVMGAWDGVRFARQSDNFTLRDAWLSNVRDDCLENDQLRSGRIVDTLFDGCFIGISLDPGRNSDMGNQRYNHKVVLDGVLMRLEAYPYRKSKSHSLRQTHGHIFKGHDWSPSVEVVNSVFAYEAVPFAAEGRLTKVLGRMTQCANNYALWLSDKALPSFFSRFPSKCFTVLRGQAARDKWAQARRNWIDCHSTNVRGSGDDSSVASRCSSGGTSTLSSPTAPSNLTIQ